VTRNYEYEDLWGAALEELWTMADAMLPEAPMRVESPMERAERSFAADAATAGYVENVLSAIADKLQGHADDGPKGHKAGLLQAVALLTGNNT
jgi:hypothetical protein